jgi:AcrR family transcriptional regulator
MKKQVAPKDKVFQTASRLFYQNGYRAIGVDTIAAESGIGKMTLYRHYPSKDNLIVAYLKDSNELFWNNFEQITKDAPTPREKLLAFFQSLQDYVTTPACYGCPFLNVATEYPRDKIILVIKSLLNISKPSELDFVGWQRQARKSLMCW